MLDDLSLDSVKQTLTVVGDNVYWQALLVLLLSLVAARLVDFVVTKVLYRVARRTRSDVDDQLIQALHRPVFYTVLLIGLWIAAAVLIEDAEIQGYSTKIIKTVVVRLGGYRTFRRLRPVAFGLILGMNVIFVVWLTIHMIWPGPPAIMID